MTIAVSTAYSSTKTALSLSAEASEHMSWETADASMRASMTDASTAFLSNSAVTTSLAGGDPTVAGANLSNWAAWEKTFYNAPAMISYQVRPISDVLRRCGLYQCSGAMRRFWMQIADNVDTAVALRGGNITRSGECGAVNSDVQHLAGQVECLTNLTRCYTLCTAPSGGSCLADDTLFAFRIRVGDTMVYDQDGIASEVCTEDNPDCGTLSADGTHCGSLPITGTAMSTVQACTGQTQSAHSKRRAVQTDASTSRSDTTVVRPQGLPIGSTPKSSQKVTQELCNDDTMSCLPGIDAIGVGFDIFTGSSHGLMPVVQFSYSNATSVYKNPFDHSANPIKYAVPAGANVADDTTGKSTVVSKTYYTSSDFAASLAMDVSERVSGVPLNAFGESVKVTTAASYLEHKEQYGSFTSSDLEVTLYDVDLDPLPQLQMTDSFKESVSALPAKYDGTTVQQYLQFMSYYGTHLVTHATFGGAGRMTIAVNSEFTSSSTSLSISEEASTHFRWATASESMKAKMTDASKSFLSKSVITTSVSGGDPTDLSNWATWEQTFGFAPAIVSFKVRPISEIVRALVNATIADNIDAAVNDRGRNVTPGCGPESAGLQRLVDQLECVEQNATHCYGMCMEQQGSNSCEGKPYVEWAVKVRLGDAMFYNNQVPSMTCTESNTDCHLIAPDGVTCPSSGGGWPILGFADSTMKACLK